MTGQPDEPGELSKWLCYDNSTINIVNGIIIIRQHSTKWGAQYSDSTSTDCVCMPSAMYHKLSTPYSINQKMLQAFT